MDTAAFLKRVRLAVQVGDSDEDYPASEILIEGTQALYERYTEPVTSLRQGYWLHRLQTPSVQGQSMYRLPPRAIVQGLESIAVSADQGNSWRLMSIVTDLEATNMLNAQQQGVPGWFRLQSDCVFMYPTPVNGLLFRFTYYLRPSVLINTVNTGVVGSWTANSITVVGDPNAYITVGETMDVVNTTGCNEVAIVNLPVTNITSLGLGLYRIDINPTGFDLSRLVQGQVVRAPDTTDQLPLPLELHDSLVAWTSAVILLSRGDADKAGQLSAKADSAIKRIMTSAQPRIKDRPPVFKTRNSYTRRRIGTGWAGVR